MTAGSEVERRPVSAVIFDLDGTLVQTLQASWAIFSQVNDRFDLGVATPEDFYGLFRGNSVFQALDELSNGAEQARAVKGEFLRLLRSEYLPPMIPGMADVVRALSAHLTLCVLSSNLMEVVRRILVANDVEYCFAHVFTADVEPDKSRAIERVFSDPDYGSRRRGVPSYEEDEAARQLHAGETMMVTDTIGDVREVQRAGVRSMGVTWGMHTQAELLEAGAEFVAVWPQEIVTYLLTRKLDADGSERFEAATNGRSARPSRPLRNPLSARDSSASPSCPGGRPSTGRAGPSTLEGPSARRERPMNVTAAVLHEPNQPLSVEQVDIGEPQADEVLVRVVGAGICHTDLGYAAGVIEAPTPLVLGHEGAGVVEKVGADVNKLAPGDHVVLTFDFCGRCANCRRGRMNHCKDFVPLNMAPDRLDGSSALSNGPGQVHAHFFGQSSFASYAIASERNAIKVPDDVPLEILGPLGCGVQTGAGAVMNTLQPEQGSSIAIFAVGSVGLSALLGAAVAGCSTIIAVDLNPERLALARELGATHTIDAGGDDVVEQIVEITGGGADYSVDTISHAAVVRQALECLASPGVCACVGFQGLSNEMTLDQAHLLFGRSLVGVIEGDSVPGEFIPRLIELYQQGRFPFDKLITRYPFERINEAAQAAHDGTVIKPVLTFGS
jgi:aryl-alcohol dehydrogenase